NEIIVNLRTGDRDLYLKSSNNKLYVYENSEDNLIFETDINPEFDKDLIKIASSYVKIDIDELLEAYFKQHYRYDIYVILTKLLIGIIGMSSQSGSQSKLKTDNYIRSDLLLLKGDNNFMSTIYTVKDFIDKNFRTFEDLK